MRKELDRQIRLMVEHGVYGAYARNRDGLETPYLSEEWWQAVGVALKSARQAGFSLCMVDEFEWPSGEARDYWMPGLIRAAWLLPTPSSAFASYVPRNDRFKVPSSSPCNVMKLDLYGMAATPCRTKRMPPALGPTNAAQQRRRAILALLKDIEVLIDRGPDGETDPGSKLIPISQKLHQKVAEWAELEGWSTQTAVNFFFLLGLKRWCVSNKKNLIA